MNEKTINSFDFYYGSEADLFNFYRIPKLLFTDERFKELSTEAKVLYGLLLDRMSLSRKNNWLDEENRVYIYYTLGEAIDFLGIGKDKGIKLFSELDDEKGCGLIKKIRQGQGKPMKIYVKNFNSIGSFEEKKSIENTVEFQSSEIPKSKKYEKSEVLTSEKPKSKVREIRSLELGNPEVKENEDSNNINNNINYSAINHISSNHLSSVPKEKDVIDEIRKREQYKNFISGNIEYELIAENYSRETADGILETMLDAVCSNREYLWVSEEMMPQEVVKSRLLKLSYEHIEYVLRCMRNNATRIYNIKSYMLTALYNSFATMDQYYTSEVNYNLYGKEREE